MPKPRPEGRSNELFPISLSLVGSPEKPVRAGLSRRVRQRISRRSACVSAASDCVVALNDLASGSLLRDKRGRPPRFDFSAASEPSGAAAPHTKQQHAAVDLILSCVAHKPCVGPDYLPEAALRSLLGADSVYDGSAGLLAEYGSAEVSLPAGQSSACPLIDVLDGKALNSVIDMDRHMLLSSEELEAQMERGIPNTYHDPVLKNNNSKYLNFIKQLYECGVLGFASYVRCELGVFFVKKKEWKAPPDLGRTFGQLLLQKTTTGG